MLFQGFQLAFNNITNFSLPQNPKNLAYKFYIAELDLSYNFIKETSLTLSTCYEGMYFVFWNILYQIVLNKCNQRKLQKSFISFFNSFRKEFLNECSNSFKYFFIDRARYGSCPVWISPGIKKWIYIFLSLFFFTF